MVESGLFPVDHNVAVLLGDVGSRSLVVSSTTALRWMDRSHTRQSEDVFFLLGTAFNQSILFTFPEFYLCSLNYSFVYVIQHLLADSPNF